MPRDPKLVAAEARLRAAQDRATRARMGPALKLTDSSIRESAKIGPLHLAAATAFWRRVAPAGLKALLEAGSAEG